VEPGLHYAVPKLSASSQLGQIINAHYVRFMPPLVFDFTHIERPMACHGQVELANNGVLACRSFGMRRNGAVANKDACDQPY
jgi:hypothetical protein